MFCSKCGKQLRDDARFCDGCGSPTKVQQTAAQNTGYYPQYTEPWASPQPVQTKPKKKTGLIVVLVLVAVLAVAAVAAVLFMNSGSPAVISEEFSRKEWEFASLSLNENGKITQDMYTYEPELVEKLWEDVSDMELRTSRTDGTQGRMMDTSIELLLYGSDTAIGTEIDVYEDGIVSVSQNDKVLYYSGGKELYAYLDGILPDEKEMLLRSWLGNESWSAISLNLYDSAGETLDTAYITDAAGISTVTDAIKGIRVSLSEGLSTSNSGREIWLFLHGEDGNMASIFVYYDGKGGMKNGDWTYSFGCLELYQTLKGLL